MTDMRRVARIAVGRPLAVALVGALGWATGVAGASTAPDRTAPTGWEVGTSEFADIWFGTLASIGFDGFGPMPLYNPRYTRELNGNLNPLRERLRAEPAFEVLHFVPVYFFQAETEEALSALAQVARSTGMPTGLSPATRFGASVIASVLTSAGERSVLAELVDVVQNELQSEVEPKAFYEADPDQARELQALWNRDFAPRLASYLNARGLQAGRVIVTPALGREGRFFEGDPSNPQDNVVMIGLGPATTPAQAVSAWVRELCYPVVREAFGGLSENLADREQASKASDRAATRCGAILLADLAPEALPAYEGYFGTGSDSKEAQSSDQTARLDRDLDALMKKSIQRP